MDFNELLLLSASAIALAPSSSMRLLFKLHNAVSHHQYIPVNSAATCASRRFRAYLRSLFA